MSELRDLNPEGALTALVSRDTNERRLSEFRVVDVTLQETVKPSVQWDEGVVCRLELRIGAAYTSFREDGGQTRKNAYRSIAAHLYGDVLSDLREIMRTVGDGKRRAAMELLDKLHERLTS